MCLEGKKLEIFHITDGFAFNLFLSTYLPKLTLEFSKTQTKLFHNSATKKNIFMKLQCLCDKK